MKNNIVELVRDTLVQAGSTFREDKKQAYQNAIDKETDEKAKWVLQTILDNAVVGTGCIVAANALVLSNQKLEPNSVYAGVPAKKVKDVTPEQREEIIKRTARDYRVYASWYEK